MERYQDALHRELILPRPPSRIVSLVPSDTFNVCALGAGEKLVGRSEYCVQPAEMVAGIPTVGGTKNPDIDKIVELAPDLVLANREENSRPRISKLLAAGLPVYVSFPTSIASGLAHLARLARMCKSGPTALQAAYRRLGRNAVAGNPRRVFVPIWKDPWMTFGSGSYADDVVRYLGMTNVFEEHARDIKNNQAYTITGQPVLDDRYPRITEQDIIDANPDVILLPDEPYEFGKDDVELFLSLDIAAARNKQVHLCSGKDLFWHGAWATDGLPRLSQLLQSVA